MTAPFQISKLPHASVLSVNALWGSIDFEPTYQRQSDVWSVAKRQLFIDSLINGFDIPKLYFHELNYDPAKPTKRYAIIDGKQRLEAIHLFMSDAFPLSEDFEDLRSGVVGASGLTYQALARNAPQLKSRLDRAELPIVVVQTDDEELIDEMFSRLNEAVPLNAPEKRNALGGPLPRQIRRLVGHDLFTSRMAFPNWRYRHLDLATKFLYIEDRNGLVDLKKRDLDEFVLDFKVHQKVRESHALYDRTLSTLDAMGAVFVPSDPLLAGVGMITLYFQLLREASAGDWLQEVDRGKLLTFDDVRARNRGLAREIQERALEGRPIGTAGPIDPVLSGFERYVQSPNDAKALNSRLSVLRHFVRTGVIPSGE